MFSKLIAFFLSPALWIIILLLLLYFIKNNRTRKIIVISAIVIFILFSNKALFDLAANAWQPAKVELPANANYSAAILLGGLSQTDSKGRAYFTEASDRYIQTIQLYHQRVVKKILITGATWHEGMAEEGDYLVIELEKAGVSPGDILADNKATNTFENAVQAKKILTDANLPPPYIVVTSALHIPRSQMVFEKAGLQVIMYPTNYLAVQRPPHIKDILLPDVKVLNDWKYLLKEWVGILGYKITGKV